MTKVVEIFKADTATKQLLPLYLSRIKAGFPSPADDYLDKKLDLNEFLIKHPASTFFVKVKGDSMVNGGIHSGDILVVDRSAEPKNNKIVVAVVNGDFTVKRVQKRGGKLFLVAENPDFPPMEISESAEFEIWGVVLHVIHSF
jgi:DNA polymerase V